MAGGAARVPTAASWLEVDELRQVKLGTAAEWATVCWRENGHMNQDHLRICASPEWAGFVQNELLPWALGDRELGDDVLEVGAGPALTTDVLRRRLARLTAVEIDDRLAGQLADRLAGTDVEVVQADATDLPFEAGRFSGAATFTMLHHVASEALQDQVMAELCRVLRPGGLLVGTDSTDTPSRRELHAGDTFLPIDPAGLEDRLVAAGFVDPSVEVVEDRFRFLAIAPAGATTPIAPAGATTPIAPAAVAAGP